jgi:hypothetical protein
MTANIFLGSLPLTHQIEALALKPQLFISINLDFWL